MTDLVGTDLLDYTIHKSESARRRLARRYAAERRFRLLGLAAVTVALLALVVLLSTIATQALPAFVLNYASLPLDLSSGEIDRENLRESNFDAVVRNAVDEALPFATSRTERRAARGLISDGAGVLLMERVLDNPDLVGSSAAIPLPLSDTADLYLKGMVTDEESLAAPGTASPSGETGEITIALDREATSRIRDDVAAGLRVQAGRLDRQALRSATLTEAAARRVATLQETLDSADADARGALEEELSAARGELTKLQQEAETARERSRQLIEAADGGSGESTLTSDSPSYFLNLNGGVVKVTGVSPAGVAGEMLVPLQSASPAAAGDWRLTRLFMPESERQVSDREIAYLHVLREAGLVETRPNWIFFTRGASREPEMAGILGAVVGSFFTLLVTLALSFPIGVASALYLEEFAPKNRWTSIIEVNINNLAAVPSIVFGLLGLAVFLNFFGLPRSTPLVGGMVLALMTLPIIIIASRAALRAVPPSIREAALGVGASRLQTVFHHVLPLAMPGIMTGTIIGMAHALGETAPLLMIGMVAFIIDIPTGIMQPATLLPVQIFMWADFPEAAFQQKTSAAIIVLLLFLVFMNAAAVLLRRRFERRW